MDEKRSYKCRECGKNLTVNRENPVPFCCGSEMEPDLPICTLSETAEHARPDQTEEPCDDGRAGKI